MALFEDVILQESIEIKATPERIFGFLYGIVDNESYRKWHPDDHVAFRWIKGRPWEEGSVAYAEEYFHGKLHKVKFIVTKAIPHTRIEYAPLSRLLRIYFPKNTFVVERKKEMSVFTATGIIRVGRLARVFAGKKLEIALSSARKHMKEEGENLQRILEADTVSDTGGDSGKK